MSKLALKIQRYCKSVLLLELLKGLAITGRHLFTKKITVFYPEEKTPQSGRFSRPPCAAALSERRRAVCHLQAPAYLG
jgi:formate hydrogenlyase subunit 6/NADH:ubiquinone oxidoreductase subunit I